MIHFQSAVELTCQKSACNIATLPLQVMGMVVGPQSARKPPTRMTVLQTTATSCLMWRERREKSTETGAPQISRQLYLYPGPHALLAPHQYGCHILCCLSASHGDDLPHLVLLKNMIGAL